MDNTTTQLKIFGFLAILCWLYVAVCLVGMGFSYHPVCGTEDDV